MSPIPVRIPGTTRRAWQALCDFLAIQVELHERAALRDRPWEEEFLHWAGDGRALHGRLVPPDGRRRSTTRSGWCPGLSGETAPGPRAGSSSPT
jgi:hypothetical protein